MDKASSLTANALNFHFELVETPLLNDDYKGTILIIGGTPNKYLEHFSGHTITVITHNAAHNALWEKEGITPVQHTDNEFDLIIHFGTKFAQENLTTLGTYAQKLTAEGQWLTVIPNRTGASRYKKDISKLFNEVETSSKSKCRIFEASNNFDAQLARKWAKLGEPKTIKDTELVTVPGVFSADKIDTGSLLIADILQQERWHGTIADLGAAYGFLSHTVLNTKHHKIRNISLYELDHRALECAQKNLTDHECAQYHWTDVTEAIPHQRPFDFVIMNPPFHEAQDSSFTLGKTFFTQAANILKPGGSLYLVANIHLPYEKLIIEQFRSHRLLKEDKGFKVIHARK